MTEMIQRDQISASGHFMVGGCDCLDLAATYGTPVIAYDVSRIRRNYRAFRQAFEKAKIRSVISYASKAFSCKAVYNLIDQEGGMLMWFLEANWQPPWLLVFPLKGSAFMGTINLRKSLLLP